jgi:hypothetical protein
MYASSVYVGRLGASSLYACDTIDCCGLLERRDCGEAMSKSARVRWPIVIWMKGVDNHWQFVLFERSPSSGGCDDALMKV